MVKLCSIIFDFLVSLIEMLLTTFFDMVHALFVSDQKKEYDARFISPSNVVSRINKGFVLDGIHALSNSNSFQHTIVYGKTGGGKSACVLLPSILNMMYHSSLVINDPGGILFKQSSGAISKHTNAKILVLNYSKAKNCGYNPLHRANTNSEYQKISKLIISTALGKSKEPFWNIAAEELLTVMIRIVKYQSPDKQNLANVLFLLNTLTSDPPKLDRLVVSCNDDLLLSQYKSFVSYDIKMQMSILATTRSSLAIFNDPEVALCTSYDSLSFEDFRDPIRPCILFINSSIPDMKYYSIITSLFMEQFWAFLMSYTPVKGTRGVFFLLDECSSLHLSLQLTISNLRKYFSGILAIYQSPFQLQSNFSEADAKSIEDNVFAKLYLPGQDISTSNKIEQTLGKFEFVDDEKSQTHIRSLMTASEVRMSDDALLICSNLGPVKLSLLPFFKQPRLKALASIPSYELQSIIPFDKVPFIQFDH